MPPRRGLRWCAFDDCIKRSKTGMLELAAVHQIRPSVPGIWWYQHCSKSENSIVARGLELCGTYAVFSRNKRLKSRKSAEQLEMSRRMPVVPKHSFRELCLFLHSSSEPVDEIITHPTNYGESFSSAIWRDNVRDEFNPEKKPECGYSC